MLAIALKSDTLLDMKTKYNLEVFENNKWVSLFACSLFDATEIAKLYRDAKKYDPKGIYQIVEILV